MTVFTRVAPENSMILVMDPTLGKVPTSFDAESVATTSTCVAIGTLMELDGDTSIHLSSVGEVVELPAGLSQTWSGPIEAGDKLAVLDVHRRGILETNATGLIIVQIWTNDRSEPDDIWILLSQG